MYSTKMPCLWCAKLIVQARIKEVVYLKSKYAKLEYANAGLIRETLAKAGIRLKELEH